MTQRIQWKRYITLLNLFQFIPIAYTHILIMSNTASNTSVPTSTSTANAPAPAPSSVSHPSHSSTTSTSNTSTTTRSSTQATQGSHSTAASTPASTAEASTTDASNSNDTQAGGEQTDAQGYPEQRHAGAVGYGPNYGQGAGLGKFIFNVVSIQSHDLDSLQARSLAA
ncbi:hypothetical protein BDP27DRAFT_387815 [Rhodocollybia butyracea]|uniref:Uncharacterized protein n=1 Tax=Rhodocollybia butyracea TaxID=206335 RepID=A0A9P5Q0T2_9AGAR|nr:hypothetical protein BDP27DRAFT_387815 [Rhodocollybia butyracea]